MITVRKFEIDSSSSNLKPFFAQVYSGEQVAQITGSYNVDTNTVHIDDESTSVLDRVGMDSRLVAEALEATK